MGDGEIGEIRVEDSANGGTDVFSGALDRFDKNPPDHLVVMVHGIMGSIADWKFTADQFVRLLPYKVIVHCSESNIHRLTLDGIDVMGERLANEVVEVVIQRPELRKISFVAHSLGGLVARYAIGRLYRPRSHGEKTEEQSSSSPPCLESVGSICGLEAVNFVTVATPHLGSRGNRQVPFLFGLTPIEKVASRFVHWIFGKTGKHLFLTDNDEGKPPLLLRMVDDCGELYFMSALRAFKRRVAYANVGYDHLVGWRTASIRRNSELPKWKDALNEKYPHIVYEEPIKEETAGNCQHITSISSNDDDELEEILVTRLTRVPWERVDVSFHTSKLCFAAHNIIQVKYPFMQEGADVIRHIIDHFVT